MNTRDYPCEFCDTEQQQEERRVALTLTRQGKLYIFEDVPAKVCPNCGHRYYSGTLMTELETLIREGHIEGASPVEAYRIPYPENTK
jgi:YgiT-type zinc finger domain-containing protein